MLKTWLDALDQLCEACDASGHLSPLPRLLSGLDEAIGALGSSRLWNLVGLMFFLGPTYGVSDSWISSDLQVSLEVPLWMDVFRLGSRSNKVDISWPWSQRWQTKLPSSARRTSQNIVELSSLEALQDGVSLPKLQLLRLALERSWLKRNWLSAQESWNCHFLPLPEISLRCLLSNDC